MIREDYIIAWIKRFLQLLAQVLGLIKREQYQAAFEAIDSALQTLLDLGPDSVTTLSEGEIMARLTIGEATPVVMTKCIMLSALLQQLGTACTGLHRVEEGRDAYIKALHLMLGIVLRDGAGPLPDYAPKIQDLLAALRDQDLPVRTYAALMVYHEKEGRYGRAEDALHELLVAAPDNPGATEMAIGFYERLLAQDDATLLAGDLPRAEVLSGLAEVRARRCQ